MDRPGVTGLALIAAAAGALGLLIGCASTTAATPTAAAAPAPPSPAAVAERAPAASSGAAKPALEHPEAVVGLPALAPGAATAGPRAQGPISPAGETSRRQDSAPARPPKGADRISLPLPTMPAPRGSEARPASPGLPGANGPNGPSTGSRAKAGGMATGSATGGPPPVIPTPPRMGVQLPAAAAPADTSASAPTGAGAAASAPARSAVAAPPLALSTPPASAAAPPVVTVTSPAAPVPPAAAPSASIPPSGDGAETTAGGSTATDGPRRADSPRPVGVEGEPATSPAGGAGASSPSAATQKDQTVYARPGDQITIALDGTGWIFTGSGDWKSGLAYVSRSFDAKGTTFVFQAESLGTYSLSFLKQSLSSGATTTMLVRVSVLSDADFAKALGKGSGARASEAEGSTGNGSGDYLQATRYFEAGLLPEALSAYEANWTPGDPAINERIASLAFRLKSYDVAKRFWKKNLSSSGDVYDQLAVAGLMKSAAATGDIPALRLLSLDVGRVTQVSLRDELLAAARFLVRSREYGLAVRYLDDYLSRYAGQRGSDEAYYLLGTVYQDASPMQDARKARQYYEKITNLYPTSRYYQRAVDHIVYLDRYFLDIR